MHPDVPFFTPLQVTHFIVHARKCFLAGLNPQGNRTVPPLRHEWVYSLRWAQRGGCLHSGTSGSTHSGGCRGVGASTQARVGLLIQVGAEGWVPPLRHEWVYSLRWVQTANGLMINKKCENRTGCALQCLHGENSLLPLTFTTNFY